MMIIALHLPPFRTLLFISICLSCCHRYLVHPSSQQSSLDYFLSKISVSISLIIIIIMIIIMIIIIIIVFIFSLPPRGSTLPSFLGGINGSTLIIPFYRPSCGGPSLIITLIPFLWRDCMQPFSAPKRVLLITMGFLDNDDWIQHIRIGLGANFQPNRNGSIFGSKKSSSDFFGIFRQWLLDSTYLNWSRCKIST